jgi:hypothetical protein
MATKKAGKKKTGARKSGAGAAGQHFDATGRIVATRAEAMAPVRLAAAAAATAVAKACLRLYNGPGVAWNINITFDPNTMKTLGGTITGTICGSGQWTVAAGGTLSPSLNIKASRPAGGGCATQVNIIGNFQNPPSWKGTYGFNGSNNMFKHTTLYCCGPC